MPCMEPRKLSTTVIFSLCPMMESWGTATGTKLEGSIKESCLEASTCPEGQN